MSAGPEAAIDVRVSGHSCSDSVVRDFHRRRHRDDLEHVAGQVLRLSKKRIRGWQIDEVFRTQRRHARAHDVDHDFGRVDQHRDITGLKVGRYGKLRGIENDWENVVQTKRPDEANDTRQIERR